MALYRDEGVVLRTAKLGEADRIITLLTQNHGKVRAVAKGVRRTKSRFGGRLEPFMRVDLLLAEGRTFDVISQAESIEAYAGPITADYAAFTAANVIAETANDLVAAEHEPAFAQYRLLIGALNALAKGRHRPLDTAESYVLRALALAGWTPRLNACVVCGRPDDLRFFSGRAGGAMCGTDHTPEARRVGIAELARMRALLEGDWAGLEGAGGESQESQGSQGDAVTHLATAMVEDWAQAILERPIRSLRLLD